ncbi:MAG: class I SAM-dependent methyltransferase [Nodosilinea sp.]
MGLSSASLLTRLRRRLYSYTLLPLSYRLKYGELGRYLARSCYVPGWMLENNSVALAKAAYDLADDAIILEIGSFVGKSAILLAGARKLRGSGKVHCVDPFDASGDPFSVPYYQRVARRRKMALIDWFKENMRWCGLTDWVEIHQGTALEVRPAWTLPLDMLCLDGDQSPLGARATYEAFIPFLKTGGVITLKNTSDRDYDEGHDGNRRIAVETIVEPQYTDILYVDDMTFARKAF